MIDVEKDEGFLKSLYPGQTASVKVRIDFSKNSRKSIEQYQKEARSKASIHCPRFMRPIGAYILMPEEAEKSDKMWLEAWVACEVRPDFMEYMEEFLIKKYGPIKKHCFYEQSCWKWNQDVFKREIGLHPLDKIIHTMRFTYDGKFQYHFFYKESAGKIDTETDIELFTG